jgi:hypothetical protein
MTKHLRIESLRRSGSTCGEETLYFEPGVNLMIGLPNSGKSKWLQMLDYILGDTDTAESAFGVELAEKYDNLYAVAHIGAVKHVLERRWKDPGRKHKIRVDETWIGSDDFSAYLLDELGMPRLHFPKGNPFAERAWPALSWRMLSRHTYRRERFWADLADKQYDVEQFAALSMFLGIAETIFPQDLGTVVERRKVLYRLQAKKEQYQDLLDEVSSQILQSSGAPPMAVTVQTLDDRIAQMLATIAELDNRRSAVLATLRGPVGAEPRTGPAIGEQRLQLDTELCTIRQALEAINKRLQDLESYRTSVRHELDRLRRAQISGDIISDLRVTH